MEFWKFEKVSEKAGLGRTAIYELIREGKFPKPIPATDASRGNAVRWISDEVEDWQKKRIEASRKVPA